MDGPNGVLRFALWVLSSVLMLCVARTIGECAQPPLSELTFKVDVGGAALFLPVSIGRLPHLFLVDTGSSLSCLDQSVNEALGPPLARTTVGAARSREAVEVFRAPRLEMGGVPLESIEAVASVDLSGARAVSGLDVRGVLGMDFLKTQVLVVNFDEGTLSFKRSLPRDAGVLVPLITLADGLPSVAVQIKGISDRFFIVDTGGVGLGAGDVEPRLLERLYDIGVATRAGSSLAVSFGANKAVGCKLAKLDEISLHRIRQTAVVFSEGRYNTLGSGFLSRFIVTFDFPRGNMYLKEGARFGEPYRLDLSGAHILRLAGKTTVDSVDPSSPAERAGLRKGDFIEKIDGRDAISMGMFEIRRAFSLERRYELSVTRRNAAITVTLDLQRSANLKK